MANRRANRMKVLLHDDIGIWLAARRLNEGKFVWPAPGINRQHQLSTKQLNSLVLGLHRHRLGNEGIITVV